MDPGIDIGMYINIDIDMYIATDLDANIDFEVDVDMDRYRYRYGCRYRYGQRYKSEIRDMWSRHIYIYIEIEIEIEIETEMEIELDIEIEIYTCKCTYVDLDRGLNDDQYHWDVCLRHCGTMARASDWDRLATFEAQQCAQMLDLKGPRQ